MLLRSKEINISTEWDGKKSTYLCENAFFSGKFKNTKITATKY